MPTLVILLFRFARLPFRGHAAIAAEIAALRLQLAAFHRPSWVWLSLLWDGCRKPMVYFRAGTVVTGLLLLVALSTLRGEVQYGKYRELPVTAITPEGWLRDWLLAQRSGLTGKLDQTLEPFTYPTWNSFEPAPFEGDNWWPYEQNAFWIEGMMRCGYLLNDGALIRKARVFTDFVLEHPAPDGFLGPRHLGNMRWPHAVFFQSLMLQYSATQDARIPRALERHYLADRAPYDFERNGANVEAILWTYSITRNPKLLQLAVGAWEQVLSGRLSKHFSLQSLLSDRLPLCHGPVWAEMIKVPVILSLHGRDSGWLNAVIHGFEKLERDQLLVDGAPSSNEAFDGTHSRAVHETCAIADLNLSLSYLLQATGSAKWADQFERAVFNAAAGAVMKDFKAYQYFSSPNQVLATHNSSVGKTGGTARMSFRPAHDVQCCSGSVNRIFPAYASRMWLEDGAGGLVAAMYGPSSVRFTTSEGVPVRVIEKTNYPFSSRIEFRVVAAKPVKLTLLLRIPGWAADAKLAWNQKDLPDRPQPGTFARIEREFSSGDVLRLTLPMRVKMTRWPENGVALERGPLVYSLKIREERHRLTEELGASAEFPAWDLLPASTWNYALAIQPETLEKDVRVVQQLYDNPWRNAPYTLRVPAKLVDGWSLETGMSPLRPRRGVFTPPIPKVGNLENVPVEEIVMVPYGSTLLRLTVLPVCRN
jgi:uncharacterized protein